MAEPEWDISSIAQPAPPANAPKYTLQSVDGVWYPRSPILDSAVLTDISALSGTPYPLLPALPNVSYILGPPNILVVNPTSFALVGFAGALVGTILTAEGVIETDLICPLGGGFAASPVCFKTRPGYGVSVVMYSSGPAASVASFWLPFSEVVAP